MADLNKIETPEEYLGWLEHPSSWTKQDRENHNAFEIHKRENGRLASDEDYAKSVVEHNGPLDLPIIVPIIEKAIGELKGVALKTKVGKGERIELIRLLTQKQREITNELENLDWLRWELKDLKEFCRFR